MTLLDYRLKITTKSRWKLNVQGGRHPGGEASSAPPPLDETLVNIRGVWI